MFLWSGNTPPPGNMFPTARVISWWISTQCSLPHDLKGLRLLFGSLRIDGVPWYRRTPWRVCLLLCGLGSINSDCTVVFRYSDCSLIRLPGLGRGGGGRHSRNARFIYCTGLLPLVPFLWYFPLHRYIDMRGGTVGMSSPGVVRAATTT